MASLTARIDAGEPSTGTRIFMSSAPNDKLPQHLTKPPLEVAPPRQGSRPAGANRLNEDVVNDRANARRGFGSELGCFLLLDRVDKSPQIDGSVLNRDGEHGRTPRLRSQPRLYLFTQLGIICGREGGEFFGGAR